MDTIIEGLHYYTNHFPADLYKETLVNTDEVASLLLEEDFKTSSYLPYYERRRCSDKTNG
ncbi:hypothetical protein IGI37_002529 [Enterococcus sp. AZ194]